MSKKKILKKMEKIELGVMVMKDGKAWGVSYKDGRSTSYGWINPIDAPLHNPAFCRSPLDVTYKNSHYCDKLSKGRLVKVKRITTVEIISV